MIRQSYACDFCGADTPDSERSVIAVNAGPLRTTYPAALDVCQGCAEALTQWAKGRNSPAPAPATHTEPVASDDTPHA